MSRYTGMTRYEALKLDYDAFIYEGRSRKNVRDICFAKAEEVREKIESLTVAEAEEVLE